GNLRYGATIVPVRDVARSLDFYVNTLGFTCLFGGPHAPVTCVQRGPVTLQLQPSTDEDVLAVTANHIAVYVEVGDLDGLWAELAPRLAGLAEGRVREPFTQPYGMREFHVKDPDGMLMFFGADA
ncbi:MAG: VOC family protein, partial [Pseudomonadota bacterium]